MDPSKLVELKLYVDEVLKKAPAEKIVVAGTCCVIIFEMVRKVLLDLYEKEYVKQSLRDSSLPDYKNKDVTALANHLLDYRNHNSGQLFNNYRATLSRGLRGNAYALYFDKSVPRLKNGWNVYINGQKYKVHKEHSSPLIIKSSDLKEGSVEIVVRTKVWTGVLNLKDLRDNFCHLIEVKKASISDIVSAIKKHYEDIGVAQEHIVKLNEIKETPFEYEEAKKKLQEYSLLIVDWFKTAFDELKEENKERCETLEKKLVTRMDENDEAVEKRVSIQRKKEMETLEKKLDARMDAKDKAVEKRVSKEIKTLDKEGVVRMDERDKNVEKRVSIQRKKEIETLEKKLDAKMEERTKNVEKRVSIQREEDIKSLETKQDAKMDKKDKALEERISIQRKMEIEDLEKSLLEKCVLKEGNEQNLPVDEIENEQKVIPSFPPPVKRHNSAVVSPTVTAASAEQTPPVATVKPKSESQKENETSGLDDDDMPLAQPSDASNYLETDVPNMNTALPADQTDSAPQLVLPNGDSAQSQELKDHEFSKSVIQQLCNRVSMLENGMKNKECNELKEELSKVKKELKEKNKELNKKKEETKEMKEELNKVKAELKEVKESNTKKDQEIKQLTERVETLELAYKHLQN